MISFWLVALVLVNFLGVEAIGSENPSIDVEIISMLVHIYQSFGLKDLKLVI